METKKSLEDRASTLAIYTSNKDTNAPNCPFCGKEQELIAVPAGNPVYRPCDCNGMKEYIKAKNQLTELYRLIEETGVELDMCSVSAARSLEHCHLGERFRECSFDNFDKSYEETAFKTALDFAKNFPENDGSGLILVGPAGTGR